MRAHSFKILVGIVLFVSIATGLWLRQRREPPDLEPLQQRVEASPLRVT